MTKHELAKKLESIPDDMDIIFVGFHDGEFRHIVSVDIVTDETAPEHTTVAEITIMEV